MSLVTTPTDAASDLKDLATLVSLCKQRGFIFPSSEIYGGINACWDYGPLGVALKKNIKDHWWQSMTDQENIEGLDAAILMHPKVWEASGHVSGFVDPLVDCRKCKSRFRADQLEATVLASKICPECQGDLTEARQFNLMFKTSMGALEDSASQIYLRPETAQGIFVNFTNVQQATRQKIPFGIAQIGKAFRNEITPGNFIFRTREFEQMEMQFFVEPSSAMTWFESWKEQRMAWHINNGVRASRLRLHPHQAHELAHYAHAAVDVEYQFPFGWQELEGIHHRGDFDLSRHQAQSGKKLEYFDEESKQRYLPYIIETSAGCDRTLLTLLVDAYRLHQERVWLQLHPRLAPYKVAIFPLMKKPELMEIAARIAADLKPRFRLTQEEAGSIGKRYRRQDEIGTPFGITIDYETPSQQSVTVRHRDTMAQERIAVSHLSAYLDEKIKNWQPES